MCIVIHQREGRKSTLKVPSSHFLSAVGVNSACISRNNSCTSVHDRPKLPYGVVARNSDSRPIFSQVFAMQERRKKGVLIMLG